MVDQAHDELRGRPVSFRIDLRVPGSIIVADGMKTRAVVRNLLSNALKFTAEGEVVLSVDDNQGGLCFVVRDTGPGIDPKDCERIFAPFCQLDGSATRHHPGIGLGLALSRKLAGLLGGSITVEARPGHGSTFRFALPLGVGAVGAKAKAA